MNNIKHIAIDLIRSQISDYTPECKKLDNEALTDLMNFAADQDMTNTISKALMEFNMVDDKDAIEQLKVEQYGGVLRYQKQKYAMERMCAAFDECNIPYVLLKGAVIRQYYPLPEIRTSSDVDVLVKKEDIDRAGDCLTDKLGWTEAKPYIHHTNYYTDDEIHIELHHALINSGYTFSELLSEPWDYAKHAKNCGYEFTNEYVYFYHCAHMAKHFTNAGFGIRFVLDLWMMNKNMVLDRVELDCLLVKGGIKKFVDTVSNLSDVWFGGAEHNNDTAILEKFLLKSAVYGTFSDNVVVREHRQGGWMSYLMKRLFMPVEQLKTIYPILNKYPVLYPLCSVMRYVRILTKNRQMAMSELKNISRKKYNELDSILNMLEMKDNINKK